MTLPLVFFVCCAFMLFMAMIFIGGAVESGRTR
jgi:hypothetical protein